MIKRWLTLAAVAVVLTGCYHQAKSPQYTPMPTPTPQTQTSQPQTSGEVTINNFAFNPGEIVVKPGAKISVTNQDSVGHSFTSDDGQSFDTGVLSQGKSATVTAPITPDTYPFHCTPHPNMQGTLVVKE